LELEGRAGLWVRRGLDGLMRCRWGAVQLFTSEGRSAMDKQVPRNGLPIVVGVDGSPESVLALRWAEKLADPLGTVIKAVCTWQMEVVYGPYAIAEWDGEPAAQHMLAAALVDAFGDKPPAGLIGECRRGQPAKVLVDEGKSAQMIIVGSRGHGGFAGMLLGSVSSACAAHASCPVLVVHGAMEHEADPEVATEGNERRAADEPAG